LPVCGFAEGVDEEAPADVGFDVLHGKQAGDAVRRQDGLVWCAVAELGDRGAGVVSDDDGQAAAGEPESRAGAALAEVVGPEAGQGPLAVYRDVGLDAPLRRGLQVRAQLVEFFVPDAGEDARAGSGYDADEGAVDGFLVVQ
jgi:hypothetical protein